MQKNHAAADSLRGGAFAVDEGFRPLRFVRRTIFYMSDDLSYALFGRFLPRLRPLFGVAPFFV